LKISTSQAGVAPSIFGAIIVDDRMRTSKAGIYAAGDVTAKTSSCIWPLMARSSRHKNAQNSNSLRYDNTTMPAIVFTDPQVAQASV